MELLGVEFILSIAISYFPFISESNFVDLFKLTVLQVLNCLKIFESNPKPKKIRNFLIFLHWCRNNPPLKTLAVLYNLSKSQIGNILREEADLLSSRVCDFVNMKDIDILDHFFLPNCVGVVDSTEIEINCWIGDSFSGKKGVHTLKYQVVCCLITGKPIHIYGPCLGKVNDASIWKDSGLGEYLEENDLWVLGDKGYQGCLRVKNCLKKSRGELTLEHDKKEYNRNISKKRIIIENHFADVKKWKVISHVFRGDLNYHVKIFVTCEILTILAKNEK
jgi:hypothetical protein